MGFATASTSFCLSSYSPCSAAGWSSSHSSAPSTEDASAAASFSPIFPWSAPATVLLSPYRYPSSAFRASTLPFSAASSSAYSSASRTIRSISSSPRRPFSLVMESVSVRPLSLSDAPMLRMREGTPGGGGDRADGARGGGVRGGGRRRKGAGGRAERAGGVSVRAQEHRRRRAPGEDWGKRSRGARVLRGRGARVARGPPGRGAGG